MTVDHKVVGPSRRCLVGQARLARAGVTRHALALQVAAVPLNQVGRYGCVGGDVYGDALTSRQLDLPYIAAGAGGSAGGSGAAGSAGSSGGGAGGSGAAGTGAGGTSGSGGTTSGGPGTVGAAGESGGGIGGGNSSGNPGQNSTPATENDPAQRSNSSWGFECSSRSGNTPTGPWFLLFATAALAAIRLRGR